MFKAEATLEVNTRYPSLSNKVCPEVCCELEHALQVAEIEHAINPQLLGDMKTILTIHAESAYYHPFETFPPESPY